MRELAFFLAMFASAFLLALLMGNDKEGPKH